jgi:hypothetical protein
MLRAFELEAEYSCRGTRRWRMRNRDEMELYLTHLLARMDIPQILDIPGIKEILERELAGRVKELKKTLRLDWVRGKSVVKAA